MVFCIVRPPGHHASYIKSQGFCIINNIALCAEYAINVGFKKIFIFDFDAHHGNGTQEIFYDRNDVFYCSIHTKDAYPKTGSTGETGSGPGTGFTKNIIVPHKCDNELYYKIFKNDVILLITEYKPDLILVSAGFDGLENDPIKLLSLTPEIYGKMTLDLASMKIPIGMVLEGGYTNSVSKCIELCVNNLST